MATYSNILWEKPLDENEEPATVIAGRIKKLIDENLLSEGERLPSLREGTELWKTPERNIRKAYHKLQKDGYVLIRRAYGTFVAARNKKDTWHWPENDAMRLNEERSCPELKEPWKIRTISAGFDYPNPKAVNMAAFSNYQQAAYNEYGAARKNTIQKAIREELSKYLKSVHVLASPEQCAYVPYNEALLTICHMVLEPGDTVVVESEEDLEALMVFARARVQVLFTGSDRNGMKTAKLEQYCRSRKVKAVFVRPDAGFPKNIHLSCPRRQELLRIAGDYDLALIVNESSHELWSDHHMPSVTMHPHAGRVIWFSTLSKVCAALSSHAVVAATPGLIRKMEEMVRLLVSNPDLCKALGACRTVNDSKFQDNVLKVKRDFARQLRDALSVGRHTLKGKAVTLAGAVSGSLWIGFKKALALDAVTDALKRNEIEVSYIYTSVHLLADKLTGMRLGTRDIGREPLVQFFDALGSLLN